MFKFFSRATLFALLSSPAVSTLADTSGINSCLSGNRAELPPVFLSYYPPNDFTTRNGDKFKLAGIILESLATQKLEKRKQDVISRFIAETRITNHIPASPKPDRYARLATFPTRVGDDKAVTLQEKLIVQGLARVLIEGLPSQCAHGLLKLEETARSKRTGLWKLQQYSIKKADQLQLSAIVSTYQIVSGQVISVSRRPEGTSFVNFGRNWSEDFTVSLSKNALKEWEAGKRNLEDLQDRTIYVRGWIEESGGPIVRISNPFQLSIALSE
ncbi:thermonuclease family protein [uncultured Cohaesibacter sp.]|uniref:thermonuclease family protein n=1 Tax=uncultured Cohaesibacter sp. TaxID=1002546 RepID=UPI00292CFC40|nr:thermonuclease family protein [uncultured Cohaesibacter sp.]